MISEAIFLEAKITAWFVKKKNAGDLLAWKQSNQGIYVFSSPFSYTGLVKPFWNSNAAPKYT